MHAVLITFTSSVPAADLQEPFERYAEALVGVDGLVMKTWIADDAKLGGFHIFRDEVSADRYLSGALCATVIGNPAFTEFAVTHFDVIDDLSVTTGSPAGTLAPTSAAH